MPSFSRIAPATMRAVLRAVAAPNAEGPLAPPTRRSERAVALALHRGFQISVLISVALLLGLLALDTHAAWVGWVKFAFGTTMTAEGVLLATDFRGARRLTLWRFHRRRADLGRIRPSLTARLTSKLAGAGLQVIGLIWVGAGLLTALLSLQAIV